MKLSLGLGWHSLSFEERLGLVCMAEARGCAAVYVDGDVSQIPSLGEADVLDGWTVTTALLARSECIPIGSIRLVHHWNAARLAQAAATLAHLEPGRLRFLISIGAQATDRRFGLAYPDAADRIQWLDEMLTALRGLWRGDEVRMNGRFVHLDGARVRPVPPAGTLPITIAGRGRRLLELVARHGDGWDVNLPPVAARVERAAAHLRQACRAEGRDPASIARSMWIFVRPDRDPDDPALVAEYRRLNPWFADLDPTELRTSIVAGDHATCRAALAERAEVCGLDEVIADLSGLSHDATRRAVEALAPESPSPRHVDDVGSRP